ncbi:MAG: rRNA maturation RNase YbeY [Candidatus Limnocylindrales bacterium]
MRSLYLGPWRIDVEWRDGVPRLLPATTLARAAAAALDAAGASGPASLGLILSDDAELAELNEAHMGKHGPTDVLSFPLLAPETYPPHPGQTVAAADAPDAPDAADGRTRAAADGRTGPAATSFRLPPGARQHLGDIVVSVERAIDQAEAGRGGQTGNLRWDARDELRLLVTHGTLHVCGWDHAEPAEEAAMRSLERSLLDGGMLPPREPVEP